MWPARPHRDEGILPPPASPPSGRYCGEERGRGRARRSPTPPGSAPATEWSLVVSEGFLPGHVGKDGGQTFGKHAFLPEPGGPMSRILWEPAAAISRALLAAACPITSAKSGVPGSCPG